MEKEFEEWRLKYCTHINSPEKYFSMMKDAYVAGFKQAKQAKKDAVLKFLKELENCCEILPLKVECVFLSGDINRICEAILRGEKC